ncbi:MAG TPA: hypothetical protein PK781_06910 [Terrimesophilobacter sp.]|nr:hypothetical protein [Terrimesophilobacter sp.]HRQ00175.1 hypothetical protein [Terrimesophilobacter sp.]
MEDFWLNALYSVTPTILVGLIFWFVLRAVLRADRSERAVYSEIEAEERARFEAELARSAAGSTSVAGSQAPER